MNTRPQTEKTIEQTTARARSQRVRTMREFAEQEIIIPDGPFEGMRFDCSRQPAVALWFDAVSSGEYQTHVHTGPRQGGKTLAGLVIPALYHLFEIQETFVVGVPTADIFADKWHEDFLPVIQRTRYRDLLPTSGGGSRGGKALAIHFRNGTTLRVLTGGGGGRGRVGFTARAVGITEADGLDTTSKTSTETTKAGEIRGVSRAYLANGGAVEYIECTLTTEQGLTWVEYAGGTKSEIVLHCPLCGKWAVVRREHLRGWQDAATEDEARENGRWHCPECGQPWEEAQRREAHRGCFLLHRGQQLSADGTVTGEPAKTKTLGFRWTAVNNFFVRPGDVAVAEWRAQRMENPEAAERELCQYWHCLPHQPSGEEVVELNAPSLMRRIGVEDRGIVPEWAEFVTCGLDLGKRSGHWTLAAWDSHATGRIIDYGVLEFHSDALGEEQAILSGLRDFRDRLLAGNEAENGERVTPLQVWIDSNYAKAVVYAFCIESMEAAGNGAKTYRFRPTMGAGASQDMGLRRYTTPKTTGSRVVYSGEEYHFSKQTSPNITLTIINVDYWKSWVHRRLSQSMDDPGALTFFNAAGMDHFSFMKHLTSEKATEVFVEGKGTQIQWRKKSQNNHWLDATVLASVAAHYCGARLIVRPEMKTPQGQRPKREAPIMQTPDGRPFFVTQR